MTVSIFVPCISNLRDGLNYISIARSQAACPRSCVSQKTSRRRSRRGKRWFDNRLGGRGGGVRASSSTGGRGSGGLTCQSFKYTSMSGVWYWIGWNPSVSVRTLICSWYHDVYTSCSAKLFTRNFENLYWRKTAWTAWTVWTAWTDDVSILSFFVTSVPAVNIFYLGPFMFCAPTNCKGWELSWTIRGLAFLSFRDKLGTWLGSDGSTLCTLM